MRELTQCLDDVAGGLTLVPASGVHLPVPVTLPVGHPVFRAFPT